MAIVTELRPRPASTRGLRGASSPTSPTPWVRPAEWLALPDVTGQQRFVGLHRIDPDSNFLSMTVSGAYTVDWGDGTTTNHAAGTNAQKIYDYSTIPNTGEAALGYRQVIVQVYPQGAANLTSINCTVRHTSTSVNYAKGWLELALNAPLLTTLVIGGANANVAHLQQATIYSHSLTSLAGLFRECYNLQSVPIFNTASVTNFSALFQDCRAMQVPPLLNTASGTNMDFMFSGCSGLLEVPLFNTAACTSMSGTFTSCSQLRQIPRFNTSNVTTFNSFAFGCAALESCPPLDTSKSTQFPSMFRGCSRLGSVPLLNTALGVNVSQMFDGCNRLREIPLLNTAAATGWNSFAAGCNSLTSLPALNASAGTTFTTAFANAGLVSCAITGINQTVSFANSKLSAAAIDAIFTNLSSTGTGKTVTVTGNWGAATCTPSIATAKGWTVTQ